MAVLESVKEFMRNIVIFSVLSAFCTHLLPEQKYQKFARFVAGLIYICMVLNLLSGFFGSTGAGITF